MTLVLLIRHAHSVANGSGILAGRTEGIGLSASGKKQARELARRLGTIPIKSFRSSPLERCEETISPWLKKLSETYPRLALQIDDDLSEVDYGEWTGQKLRSLSKEALWKKVQDEPSRVTFPKGESLMAMQARAMRAVQSGLDKRGKGHVVLVSHGDVLKSIIASALNLHLDDFQRIVIDPASVSILDYSSTKPRLILMNDSHSRLGQEFFAGRGRRVLVGGGAGLLPKEKRG
jgi:probable phosphomutase (TIGR03848 family)